MTIDKGILIHNIYYMLTYAFSELRQNNYENIEGESFDNVFDLFGEILYKATAYQLKRGLHKEYVGQSAALTTVRGKIDIQPSIALRMQQKLQGECVYDEFSENNLHNRIIKSTLNLLMRSKEVKVERRQQLRKVLLFFSNVSECDLKTVRWNDIKYDRNSHTYKWLHYICYFVVKGLLLTTDSGAYTMQSFDEELMSRLFEKFVLNYYRRHYPLYCVKASKVEWNIDEEKTTMTLLPDMRTDITIRFPKRTLIIDTKYYGKSMQINMGKHSIISGNLYQINSYVLHEDKHHLGNVDGMLLYAKTQEEITPNGCIQLKDGNRIYFKTLDLNCNFDEIKHQLNEYIEIYL
ncbi:MAG: 5-methylcytosine-specific restriction endonuclease system specificity protein McrC [Muribaculaceae bacterium]|nr:5-methylcytosine-specific restriction endonuclease system specificity protein McrC [Muribaculaceae bacterium]